MKATQIYLSDAEHAALRREAERAGCSMTAVVRGLIDRYLLADESPPTDLTDLVGIVSTAEPTDVGADRHRMLYEDLLADLRGHERPLRIAEP